MNRQSSLFQEISIETIRDIFAYTLQETIIWETELLDGGMFNTTYMVEYSSFRKKAVLRLGPVNRHLLMGFEENLMDAEVYTYSVYQTVGIPCSRVLAYDKSRQIVDRDFMIVEYIPSTVMLNTELTEERRKAVYRQMGIYLAKSHRVEGNAFGFLSRICNGKIFEKWSDALIFEVEDITERFERLGGLHAEEAEALRQAYYKNRELLDEVKMPYLLHTDLWEGNVLLDRDTFEIAAIIDCDRTMFGDKEFEFASPWMENTDLQEGYHSVIHRLVSPGDLRRRRLYQMFFCLLESYVGYGEYNHPELYETRKKQWKEYLLRC